MAKKKRKTQMEQTWKKLFPEPKIPVEKTRNYNDLFVHIFFYHNYPEFKGKPYTHEELRDYARGLVDAAREIAKIKPDLIVVPLRGAHPLWRGVAYALEKIRKENPELENYHPYIISPPNTGNKLRRSLGRLIGYMYSFTDLKKAIKGDKIDTVKLNKLSQNEKIKRLLLHSLDKIGKVFIETEMDKERVAELLKSALETSGIPSFNRVLLLDEIFHGGAITQNYHILKKALPQDTELCVIGIGHAPNGEENFKKNLKHPNANIWKDKRVKTIPVKKLVSMDSPDLLGVTYVSLSEGEPVLFGIEKAKPSSDVFPITPYRYGKFKRFLRDLSRHIDAIFASRGKEARKGKKGKKGKGERGNAKGKKA